MVVCKAVPLMLLLVAALLPGGTSKRLPSIEVLAREEQLQMKITALQMRMVALYDAHEVMARPNTTTTATTTTTRDQALANARLKAFVEGEMNIPSSSTLIFTAVTKGFIPSLVNWITFLYRLDLKQVFVFAMDDESYKWLNDRGFKAYRGGDVPANKDWAARGGNHFKRMQVWYERSFIVWQLLQLGYNVVQSDGDALWIQNPMFEFNELLKTSDVIFSRGNARAGQKGRGTGVCMGLVMYKASPGAIEFLHDILEKMPIANDVDQGIANTFVGGSRGSNRDKDKFNPDYWHGEYKNTKWVQVPQVRYARHGGAGLETVEEHVDLHVFHPTDEGWLLPFRYIPTILPLDLWTQPTNVSEPVKTICHSGRWFERMGYSERDQKILACCGLWLMKEGWNELEVGPDKDFEQWLLQASHLQRLRDYKRDTFTKPAHHEPRR